MPKAVVVFMLAAQAVRVAEASVLRAPGQWKPWPQGAHELVALL